MVKNMRVIRFQLHEEVQIEKPLTACIGYFDGLHLGHQQLIQRVLEIAKKTNTEPALITFDPDPWEVLHPNTHIAHLTPLSHRLQLAQSYGIQTCIVLQFDEILANISYEVFHSEVIQKLYIQTLVCGFDFHYACKGEGNTATLLKQTIFNVSIVDEVSQHHKKISSSAIEKMIEQGDMQQANICLGRSYELRGVIIQGAQQGRKHGFPTANLGLQETYVIPARGVYIGEVIVNDNRYPAMINIGHNPTYNYQQNISIEAHILDFNEMIYGEKVVFCFHQFIRKEQKFANTQALLDQLSQDLKTTRMYFQKGV